MNASPHPLPEAVPNERPYRTRCLACRRPTVACYCSTIRPFTSVPRVVILIHPLEARREIATGRMSNLCLENSLLFQGVDFSKHPEVNALLADPSLYPVLLYPSPVASDLSLLTPPERRALFPEGRTPVVFVLDGTWRSARKMRRLSRNLHSLPVIQFVPRVPSRFEGVRRQPAPHCYSTIEAIHEMLDLFMEGTPTGRPHDNLLETFTAMVGKQLEFVRSRRAATRGDRSLGLVNATV